jgi:hypothetical protein
MRYFCSTIPLIVTVLVLIFNTGVYCQPPFGGGTPFHYQRMTTIPFQTDGHILYVDVYLNNSRRSSRFILDTGAFSSIGEPLRNRLNLSKGRSLQTSGAIKYAYSINEPVSIQVGQVGVNDFKIVCMDYDYFYQADPNFQGFLGSDFLKNFYVKIDYRNRQLTLSRDPIPVTGTSQKYLFRMNTGNAAGLPKIQCRVDDSWSWSGLIDTGSPHAIVFPVDALSQMRSTGQPIIESDGIMISWPNSHLSKNYLSRVDQLRMGDLEIRDIPVVFANTEDIILGESFLSQYEIYLNYPANEVILTPQRVINWKNNFFSAGIKLERTGDQRTIIEAIWKGSPADLAGLSTGTEVLQINRQSTTSMSREEWVNLLNNDRIPTVELVIKQGYREKTYQLKKAPLLPAN